MFGQTYLFVGSETVADRQVRGSLRLRDRQSDGEKPVRRQSGRGSDNNRKSQRGRWIMNTAAPTQSHELGQGSLYMMSSKLKHSPQ